MTKMSNLDHWLASARADVALRAPGTCAAERALARWREGIALGNVAAVRDSAGGADPRVRVVRVERTANARWLRWLGGSLAMAGCAVLLLAALALAPLERTPAAQAATPFIALASAEQIAAASDAVLLTTQVPRMALGEYGLPVDPARVDEPVVADLLLSRGGLLLAVRFKE